MHDLLINSLSFHTESLLLTRFVLISVPQKYRSLKDGERLSMSRTGYLVELRVHSTEATTTYTLNLATGELQLRQMTSETFGA